MGNKLIESLEYHIPYSCREKSPEEEASRLRALDHFYSFTKATQINDEIMGVRKDIQYQLNTKFYGLNK